MKIKRMQVTIEAGKGEEDVVNLKVSGWVGDDEYNTNQAIQKEYFDGDMVFDKVVAAMKAIMRESAG